MITAAWVMGFEGEFIHSWWIRVWGSCAGIWRGTGNGAPIDCSIISEIVGSQCLMV